MSFAEREDNGALTEFEELLDLIYTALHMEQSGEYERVQAAIVERLGGLREEKAK